jgi:hypothetical protein
LSLRQDFSGAGARTWELRLNTDGSVVEERENIFGKVQSEIYSIKRVRKISRKDTTALVIRAAELMSGLPEYLDNGRIEVDPETKAIRVQLEGNEHFAGWASYSSTLPNSETKEFERVWVQIQRLLLGTDG